jgi:hypothetical protein
MLVLIGGMVLWMDRSGVVPPTFVPYALLLFNLIDATTLLYTPWPIVTIATILLLIGIRRAKGINDAA